MSVEAFGSHDQHLASGSFLLLRFSHNTNTPPVLRSADLRRVIQVFPDYLAQLPHFALWRDMDTLVIVFPSMDIKTSVGVKMREVAVTFISSGTTRSCV